MKKTIIQYKDEEPPGITFFSLNPSKKKQQKPIKNLSFLDEE